MTEKVDATPQTVESTEAPVRAPANTAEADLNIDRLLLRYLLQNIREAVLFVGRDDRILAWNRAATNLFGPVINCKTLDAMLSLIRLTPRQSQLSSFSERSVREAIDGRKELILYAAMEVANRPASPVDLQLLPMLGDQGQYLGCMLILHDATYKVNLQQQVQQLMEKSTCDVLTGVANRGEFERVLTACCQNSNTGAEFSLIICDIDYFKRINDDFGHDVGDQALIAFATILNRSIRANDLLARYGGEEFVIICHDTSAAAALECAEKIRSRLERTPLPVLRQKNLTASFGVAQFLKDDDAKSIFVRADQALLRAKESGRNRVVLGRIDAHGNSEFVGATAPAKSMATSEDVLLSREVYSSSPIEVLAAKLDGFVQENQAQVLVIEPNRIVLQTTDQAGFFRRGSDRRIAFQIEIRFQNLVNAETRRRGFAAHSRVLVAVSPVRQRDRRLTDVAPKAEAILRSLFSFLMLNTEQLDNAQKS